MTEGVLSGGRRLGRSFDLRIKKSQSGKASKPKNGQWQGWPNQKSSGSKCDCAHPDGQIAGEHRAGQGDVERHETQETGEGG